MCIICIFQLMFTTMWQIACHCMPMNLLSQLGCVHANYYFRNTDQDDGENIFCMCLMVFIERMIWYARLTLPNRFSFYKSISFLHRNILWLFFMMIQMNCKFAIAWHNIFLASFVLSCFEVQILQNDASIARSTS